MPAMDLTIVFWLVVLLAYLLGSVSFAIVVSRVRGLADPRSYGSGNPGATNIMRSGDKMAALLTLLGDAAKGWLAVWFVRWTIDGLQLDIGSQQAQQMLAAGGLAVFLGHLFPVFFRFRGGKGVATALGVLLGLSPVLGLATLSTWLVVFGLTKISSLSALVAAIMAPVYVAWLEFGLPRMADGLVDPVSWWQQPIWRAVFWMSVFLLIRHHRNIRGLASGREAAFKKKPKR
ncbi:MAG: acyl-phosphate glycerol 3-phosphate acyltransferase [Pseudomonadota bacterium]|jgi:glycerol-3-phosphate acyltransferase PlsY